MHSLLRGLDGVGNGWARRSTVAGARVAAGTPCAGQTPVVLGSSEVERVRRGTVEVPGCFIGAGAGQGAGWPLARRGARAGVLWRTQSASNTWSFSSARVPQLTQVANVRILAKIRRESFPGT